MYGLKTEASFDSAHFLTDGTMIGMVLDVGVF